MKEFPMMHHAPYAYTYYMCKDINDNHEVKTDGTIMIIISEEYEGAWGNAHPAGKRSLTHEMPR